MFTVVPLSGRPAYAEASGGPHSHTSAVVHPVTSRHTDITVIVTNYNYGTFLEEAIDSVLKQEGGPPQVIVVDDGSTDPYTLSVLDRLPEGVRLIRRENEGVASARNVGLRHADTPYMIILDADDRLRPRALNLLRQTLENDPELGFAYGITRFFGEWEGEMTMPPYDPYKLLYRHTIGTTCLMRRELVDAVGGFDSSFGGYEDWEFWLHALQEGWRGRRVEEVTFEYRRHGSSKLTGDRLEYRMWFKRLRRKHADLYARRGELARESDLSPLGRVVYRWWWGARPMPARIEHWLHSLLWGVARWRSDR
jgi:glycosyltransferase involved in cell wall biosynthesis